MGAGTYLGKLDRTLSIPSVVGLQDRLSLVEMGPQSLSVVGQIHEGGLQNDHFILGQSEIILK